MSTEKKEEAVLMVASLDESIGRLDAMANRTLLLQAALSIAQGIIQSNLTRGPEWEQATARSAFLIASKLQELCNGSSKRPEGGEN